MALQPTSIIRRAYRGTARPASRASAAHLRLSPNHKSGTALACTRVAAQASRKSLGSPARTGPRPPAARSVGRSRSENRLPAAIFGGCSAGQSPRRHHEQPRTTAHDQPQPIRKKRQADHGQKRPDRSQMTHRPMKPKRRPDSACFRRSRRRGRAQACRHDRPREWPPRARWPEPTAAGRTPRSNSRHDEDLAVARSDHQLPVECARRQNRPASMSPKVNAAPNLAIKRQQRKDHLAGDVVSAGPAQQHHAARSGGRALVGRPYPAAMKPAQTCGSGNLIAFADAPAAVGARLDPVDDRKRQLPRARSRSTPTCRMPGQQQGHGAKL